MTDEQERIQAQALEKKLNGKYPRLKWAVLGGVPASFSQDDLPGWCTIRAKIELKDDALTGLMPMPIEGITAEVVSYTMIPQLLDKIIHDPLDVHKVTLECT